MFKRNDPLVQSVQKVMEENELRRKIEKKLCEELGIYSRKQLPLEHFKNYDALLEQRINEALHPNQQKLDVHEPEKDKLTAQDFKMLRAKKTMKEEEGEETREGGAVVDTKTNKPVVSDTAPKATPSQQGPTPAEREALTNKIKQMKEAKLASPETGSRKTPGSNQMCEEEQLDEKAPSGAKYERMVKHIKDKYSKDGLTDKEKSIAYATAWKAKNKEEMKESLSLNDVMEEIRKKLGDKKMKEIDEQENDRITPEDKANMVQQDKENQELAAKGIQDKENQELATKGREDAAEREINRVVAQSRGETPRNVVAPGSAAFPKPEPTPAPAAAPAARSPTMTMGPGGGLNPVGSSVGKPATPPAAAPAARSPTMTMGPGGGLNPVGSSVGKPATPPAAAPAARSQSTAPAARPQPATSAPKPATSENPYEKYGANEPDAGPAAFFRADREAMAQRQSAARPAAGARPAARPGVRPQRVMRESLETTIKNMIKD